MKLCYRLHFLNLVHCLTFWVNTAFWKLHLFPSLGEIMCRHLLGWSVWSSDTPPSELFRTDHEISYHISCYLCILLKFSTLITFDKPTTEAVNSSFYNYLLQPMMFAYHLDSDGCHNSSCLIKRLGKIEEPSTKSSIDDKKYC